MPPAAVGAGMAGARRGPRRDGAAAGVGRGSRSAAGSTAGGRGLAVLGRGVAAAVPLGAVVRVLERGVVLAIGGKDSSGSVRDCPLSSRWVGRGSGVGYSGRSPSDSRAVSHRREALASL